MSPFIIALVLLFVTGLLTVTDAVSVSLVDPVFILCSPILLLSVLIILGHSYVYSVDFARRIVWQHDFYEFHKLKTPGFKPCSDWYVLAVLQIGVGLLRQELESVILRWRQSLSHEISRLVDHMITAPLAIARSRLQSYRDALLYSTSRIVVALVCLTSLVFYFASVAPRYAVGKLAGLALPLYCACTPTLAVLFIVIIIVAILAYSFREHLAICRVIKYIGSIYRTLCMGFSLDFNEFYDKDHDFLVDSEPQLEVVRGNAGYLPDLNAPQRYLQVNGCPTELLASEAPFLVPNQARTAVAAGLRPRFDPNPARRAYEESLRLQEESDRHKSLADYRFIAQPTRFSSGSAIGRLDRRLKSTLPGVGSTPMDQISKFLGTMSLKDDQNPSSTAVGQSLHPENTSNSPGQLIEPPAASSAASSASPPSPGSLPDLVTDTDMSDISSELDTSSDERGEIDNIIIRSSSSDSNSSSRRVCGSMARPQSKSSPLYAPKEIVEAQIASEEDKVAAVLRRSQWKQKQKRWTRPEKQAKKSRAPIDARRGSPAAELPRCKATRSGQIPAPPPSGATTPAPMEPSPDHTLPLGSPGSTSPVSDLDGSNQIPVARNPLKPALKTPKDPAAPMNGKAKKTGTTRKVRFAPVYMLSDKERTVVNMGEKISSHTRYQAKDKKGTRPMMTGLMGMRL